MSLVNVWHPAKLQPDWEKRFMTDYQTRFHGDLEIRKRKLFVPPRETQTPIRDLIPLSDDAVLATHWNWCTLLWNVFKNSGIGAYSPKGVKGKVFCSAIMPRQPCLIQGMGDGTIAFMAMKPPFEHAPFHVVDSKRKSIFRLVISPDERFLLATDNDEHIVIYELQLDFLGSAHIGPAEWRKMKPVKEVHDIETNIPVQWLAFTPDSQHFVSSSHESRKLVLWDAPKARVVAEKKLEEDLGAIAIMPNGSYVVLDSESKATFWELPSMNKTDTIEYKGWRSSCSAIALSPNGRYLVTPSYSTLILWDLETGKAIRDFQTRPSHDDFGPQSKYPSPREPVTALTFLPDGKHLVSGGEMGGLNLWDLSETIK